MRTGLPEQPSQRTMRKAWRRPACDEDCDWRKGRVQKHQRCFGAMTQDLQGIRGRLQEFDALE
jgi:hypothetical protein